MTLLIGTVARSATPSKSHIVITADGRCTVSDGVTRTVQSDNYQKIFPVANTSVAIAHHGENVISGKPVKDFLADFMCRNTALFDAGISQIANSLKDFASQQAEDTLKRIKPSKFIGFWIAGFGKGRIPPELHELSWKKELESGQIGFKNERHGNLTFGGDAKCFVDQYCTKEVDGMFSWDRLPDKNVDYALRFHTKLYKIAEFAQLKGQQELFGGHKHQLLITPGSWRWTMAPSDE